MPPVVRYAAPAVLLGALLAAPGPAAAQNTGTDATDPPRADSVLEAAREAQRDFEMYRRSRIPVSDRGGQGGCDEWIGRICIWFGGEGESNFPPEPPETVNARRGLIGVFLEADALVDDPWLLGQIVHYAVEEGDPALAERKARECEIDPAEAWWCDALLGYSMHMRGAFVEAEAAFRDALAAMPDEALRRWWMPRFVLTGDAVEDFRDMDPRARHEAWERFWTLSDPLWLVPGNDRMTDHFARLVQERNFEDAEHPQGLEWDEDLAATLVRYGRIVGWSRTSSPPSFPRPGGRIDLTDRRRMIGHHDPMSRGYLFPERFLASPADVPPESWITAPREARTWYAPPYAPDFRGLESQVGRFRRDGEMLVVGAFTPEPPDVANPFDGDPLSESVEAGFFLRPVDGGPVVEALADSAEGVLTLRAPPGGYVSSLEVFDRVDQRAWRARQGVKQEPLVPGLVAVSDLMILEEGAPLPETLDEAIPHVRPGVRIEQGERFPVVWEVYGLQVDEPVRVTIGFTAGRPGFLERVGDFLGVVETEEPVEITFSDAGPEQELQTAFRAVELELPELEPGAYTLHLRLELTGREPVTASRPIVVEE